MKTMNFKSADREITNHTSTSSNVVDGGSLSNINTPLVNSATKTHILNLS